MELLERWLQLPRENEHLEFKEARNQYDSNKLLKYCVAFANEGGGHLVFGVTDKPPRQVVGSKAIPNREATIAIILEKLRIRVEITELQHSDGRVVIFEIPSRPQGQPLHLDGAYLMRAGEELQPMTPDQLRKIFDEGKPDWLALSAKTDASADDVIALLDTQTWFELLKLPYPTTREGVLERLRGEGLIVQSNRGWQISNLAAILLAKRLDAFPSDVARKAARVVIYEGTGKLKTREDKTGQRGYAVGFESLVDFVHSSAPRNHMVEQVLREEVKMFPKQALRELIANALVHQDFEATGASAMIEMYSDRIEISNPGQPPIQVERFIDEYRSRNERLADLMRRMGICEEKGSGIDKVIDAAEVFQLPAPDFRVGETRTTALLFAHQEFNDMSKKDRIRACYQHCCLMYVNNQRMSNESMRKRFDLSEKKTATVSLIIGAAKEAKLIKADDSESSSTRYARYLPYWA
ncbi:ATP-binding protein [Iodobacter sp. LRB]|uniref:ATP-binding protein n=1 Tax=Iodobacter sp. LRB TaxID=3127955 RepID=UPI00307D24DC